MSGPLLAVLPEDVRVVLRALNGGGGELGCTQLAGELEWPTSRVGAALDILAELKLVSCSDGAATITPRGRSLFSDD